MLQSLPHRLPATCRNFAIIELRNSLVRCCVELQAECKFTFTSSNYVCEYLTKINVCAEQSAFRLAVY